MTEGGVEREITVTIVDSGRVIPHVKGETLLETLLFEDEDIVADCGGASICGTCSVHVVSAPPPAEESDHELLGSQRVAEGWRLACRCYPTEDLLIEIDRSVGIHAMRIETSGLSHVEPQVGAIQQSYGLAIDLGTTTIVCYLVDLSGETGDLVVAFPNPQRLAGADVVSRIAYAHEDKKNLEKLCKLVANQINRRLIYLFEQEGVSGSEITRIIMVGNMTMTHLFQGMDPWALGIAPYQPEQRVWDSQPAAMLFLPLFGTTPIHSFPGIAGHLGGDTVAGLMALNLRESKKTSLFLDLGTNGEIVVVHQGKAHGCTCAAGPAFEGVRISCGIPAVPGAINEVVISGGDIQTTTIEGAPPVGLCGSGLADAIVALLAAGLVDPSGRITPPEQLGEDVSADLRARVLTSGRGRKIALGKGVGHHAVEITQLDIREVQLAKGAFRTGIDILCRRVGVEQHCIDQVYIAGGFGNALKPSTLIALGVLPPELQDRIIPAGNVAGVGARAALFSDAADADALDIANWVEHLPLESAPDFSAAFTANLTFPKQ
ncbi:MAG: DUF4445 domain-containing protein [Halieaceae bacterium]|jgi:uncharacterized 2Fe-2S/4Fe-4S cluster protein (DUF4445 family)|nr:DUF4445 domain-containing protein [Halieaceae bacterium]